MAPSTSSAAGAAAAAALCDSAFLLPLLTNAPRVTALTGSVPARTPASLVSRAASFAAAAAAPMDTNSEESVRRLAPLDAPPPWAETDAARAGSLPEKTSSSAEEVENSEAAAASCRPATTRWCAADEAATKVASSRHGSSPGCALEEGSTAEATEAALPAVFPPAGVCPRGCPLPAPPILGPRTGWPSQLPPTTAVAAGISSPSSVCADATAAAAPSGQSSPSARACCCSVARQSSGSVFTTSAMPGMFDSRSLLLCARASSAPSARSASASAVGRCSCRTPAQTTTVSGFARRALSAGLRPSSVTVPTSTFSSAERQPAERDSACNRACVGGRWSQRGAGGG